jgi:hypothetical protein
MTAGEDEGINLIISNRLAEPWQVESFSEVCIEKFFYTYHD